jgi:sirohydrochlorin ferrochelatase
VTALTALIVAHGQPSDPGPAEAALAALAARVAAHLPGWRVGSATLAAPGALKAAVAALGPGGRAFPLFMAGGWFVRSHLPARLAEAGAQDWLVLEPLGCDDAVQDLAVQRVVEAGPVGSVLVAAHGSGRSSVPSDIARHLAEQITARTGVPAQAAFIDQVPTLAEARGHGPGSVCLPYFAAEGGHVTDDLPKALADAGFQGLVLPALGLDPRLPEVIAQAIRAGVPVCVRECRWRRP